MAKFLPPLSAEMDIDDMRAQAIDKVGGQPGVTLRTTDGGRFLVPHPLCNSDEVQALLDELNEKGDNSSISLARAVLGEEEHQQFIASGGRSNDVALVYGLMMDRVKNAPNLPR